MLTLVVLLFLSLILFHATLLGWSRWLEYLNPDKVDW